MNRIWLIATAGLLLAAFAPPAQATSIIGSSSGTFSNVTGCGSGEFCGTTNSNHTLRWGSVSSGYWNGPSTLTSTSPFNFNAGTDVVGLKLAELTWYNNATSSSLTPDEFHANWNLAILFTSPSGGDSDQINLKINNTRNPLGDYITFDDLSGLAFTLPGVTVSNIRYLLGAGAGSSFSSGSREWYNPEITTSTLYIVADFKNPAGGPPVVPEPGTVVLLGSGLGVIGLAAWRRKK